MSESRPSPETRDKLAGALRDRLGRQRLRPLRWMGAALAIVGLLATGIRWGLRPPPTPPTVVLVAFDALAIDGQATVSAQVVAPSEPDANLAGLPIEWRRAGKTVVAPTDAAGWSRLVIEDVGNDEIVDVSYVDPLHRFRRVDRARVVSLNAGAVFVESIDGVLGHQVDWASPGSTDAASIRFLAATPVVYCSGSVSPIEYRNMRTWLAKQVHKGSLSDGPLVRESVENVSAAIKHAGRDIVGILPPGTDPDE